MKPNIFIKTYRGGRTFYQIEGERIMDLSKTRLTESDKVRFRKHWKKYCKDISPKKAMIFLWQTFIEMDKFAVKDMYWEWRDEYKASEEW